MSAALNQKSTPTQGRCVKPRLFQERSFVNSVTELVSNAMPNQSASSLPDVEKIEWVSFEDCDLTDPSLKFLTEKVIGSETPIILVIGFTCGYQIWAVMNNGDCEELLSVRDIPVKCVKFLPQPKLPSFENNVDKFSSSRPLLAVCDGASTGRQYCSVNFVSLRTGESVRNCRYEDVVVNILTNKRAVIVIFNNKFVVLDSLTLSEQFWIKNIASDMEINSIALSSVWLAMPDNKINTVYQSCGGVSVGDDYQSYTNQVVSAAKNLGKTVTEFGATIATSIAGTRPITSKSQKSNEGQIENQGIVTIVHVEQFSKDQTDIHSSAECAGIVAHFPAHVDERVAAMKFNSNGTLLLTCGSSGQQFHVFLIMPHPSSSSLGAVHHLYTLQRGTTVAKVHNIAFSIDSRWVAISTYNGTTHLFPITPYGGPINVRTHCGPRVVNRESRFFRSAGLDTLDVPPTGGQQLLSSSPVANKVACTIYVITLGAAYKELHPSINTQHLSLYRSASNPRLPPYSPSITVFALRKIKHKYFGLSNLGVDFTTAKISMGAGGGGKITKKYDQPSSTTAEAQKCKIVGIFSASRGWKALNPSQKPEDYPYSLYIIGTDGALAEHQLSVKPDTPSATRLSSDNPVALQILPVVEWPLNRLKTDPEITMPLHKDHILLLPTSNKRKTVSEEFVPSTEKENMNNLWISQVEIVTYTGPHRRLWMGPQFTFKTYFDSQRSAPLVSPDGRPRIDRSEPMAMPGRMPLNSVPVLIEASSSGSFDHAPNLVVEVCGSWSDNDYISLDDQEGRLRESIADAMLDRPSSPTGGPLNADCASYSGEELSLSSVGSSGGRSRGGLSHSPSRDSQLQFGGGEL